MNKNKITLIIKIKKILLRIWYGFLLGISDGIPGYSGGTTLSLLGSYDELMFSMKQLFSKNKINLWFKNLFWLVPFFLSWILCIVGFSFITSKISYQGKIFQSLLIIIFLIFSFFSCFYYFYKYYYNKKIMYVVPKKLPIYTGIMSISLLIMIGLGIGVYFQGGITLNKDKTQTLINIDSRLVLIVFMCFLSGFLMLVPGISGGFVLLVSSTYKDVYWTILQNPFQNLLPLFLVLVLLLLGVISEILVVSFFLKKIPTFFYWFSFGLVIGSPISILLGLVGNADYINALSSTFNSKNTNMIIILVSIILTIICNVIILVFMLKKKNFNILKNSALLVVDMQNDFYENGSLAVLNAKEIVGFIQKIILEFESKKYPIIFTMDSHPKDHISFEKWKPHCIKGTKGFEIIEELNYFKKDLIVEKGNDKTIDNYSAFYNGNKESILNKYLQENNIFNIYLVGVAGDFCIKETAIDLVKNKYNVILLKDGIRNIDQKFDIRTIDCEITIK